MFKSKSLKTKRELALSVFSQAALDMQAVIEEAVLQKETNEATAKALLEESAVLEKQIKADRELVAKIQHFFS